MTIVVREKEDVLDQIIKHLEKLVNTVEVVDFRNTDNVYRETVLTRIGVDSASRHEVIEFCQILGASIVDVTRDALTIVVVMQLSRMIGAILLIALTGLFIHYTH